MEKVDKDKFRNAKIFSSSTKMPKLREEVENKHEEKPSGLKACFLNIFRKNNTCPEHKPVTEPKKKKIPSGSSCPKPPVHKAHNNKKQIFSSKKLGRQDTPKFNAFPAGFTHSSLNFHIPEDSSLGGSLVINKENMIKEGIKLTKLSEKFKPKSFAVNQSKKPKGWIHPSKKEKGLAREQKSIQKKLENLYQP